MTYQVASAFSAVAKEVLHGSSLTELVSGSAMTEEGTITLSSDADGEYIQAGPSAGLLFPNASLRPNSTDGLTVVFVVKQSTLAAQTILGGGDAGSAFERFGINLNNTTWTALIGALAMRCRNTSSSVNSGRTGTSTVVADTLLKCVIKRTPATGLQFWVNGSLITTAVSESTAAWSTGSYTQRLGVLQNNDGGTRTSRGTAKLYFLARLFSDDVDGASLSSNPYQIVESTGATDATADGGTGFGVGSGSGGEATGGTDSVDAIASGGTGTGTGSGSGGDATGGSSGSFTTSPMYSSGILQVGVDLDWTWYPGAIGAAPTGSLVHGTGTTNASGTLTASGLPTGAGFLIAATAMGAVWYETGTVS